jgi:hypothetical protein
VASDLARDRRALIGEKFREPKVYPPARPNACNVANRASPLVTPVVELLCAQESQSIRAKGSHPQGWVVAAELRLESRLQDMEQQSFGQC